MTIRKAIYDFRAIQDVSGYVSDDNGLADQYIYNLLLQSRSRFYRQKMQNGKMFSPQVYQSLHCVDLIEADKTQCPNNPPSGCIWLQSECTIPMFLKIKSVTNDIGSLNFSYISWNNASNIKTQRTKSSRKAKYYTFKATLTGVKLFVLNDIFVKSMSVEAILENPLEGIDFCGGNDAKCFTMEQDFFTDQDEFETILKIAVDSFSRIVQFQRPDIVNDDKNIQ